MHTVFSDRFGLWRRKLPVKVDHQVAMLFADSDDETRRFPQPPVAFFQIGHRRARRLLSRRGQEDEGRAFRSQRSHQPGVSGSEPVERDSRFGKRNTAAVSDYDGARVGVGDLL